MLILTNVDNRGYRNIEIVEKTEKEFQVLLERVHWVLDYHNEDNLAEKIERILNSLDHTWGE